MSRVCVAEFSGDTPYAVSLDGVFTGIANKEGLTLVIPPGEHLFTFLPLCVKSNAFCASMYTDLFSPSDCPAGITLRLLPGGEALIFVCFKKIFSKTPHIIKERTLSQLKAILYFDSGVNLSIEEEGKIIAVKRICDDGESFGLFIRGSAVYAKTDTLAVVYEKSSGFEIIAGVYEDDGNLFLKRNGVLMSLYKDAPEQLIIKDSRPVTLMSALALISKYKLYGYIDSVLTKSLCQCLSKEDICSFFDNFYDIEEALCDEKTLMLSYEIKKGVYEIKSFGSDIISGKIDNIYEN